MSDFKEKLNRADAPQMTNFLKNEIGNGSMKDGLRKLLDDSDRVADLEVSNKDKDKGLVALGGLLIVALGKLGFDEYKKKKQKKLEKEKREMAIKEIEKLSEKEIEDIVTEALEIEEEGLKEK